MWSRLLALALLLLPAPALAGVKEKVAALAPSGLVLVMDAKGNELVAQNADRAVRPGLSYQDRDGLAGDGGLGRRLPLRDPLLPRRQAGALRARRRRSFPDLGGAGDARDRVWSRRSARRRSPASCSTQATILRISASRASRMTDEAYDALNSALAVNFNTVYAVRSGDKVRSAEKQTPITPLAITEFRARGPSGSGRISLSQDPAVSLQYAGELIAAFIERAGGSVNGKISTGTVPEGLEPVYVHRQSRPLSKILVELLRASNNYIANQVFLEIGGHRLGGPVSLEKSLQVANEMLAAHGLAAAIHLEEGSGISRNNRFTARGLAKVLELFAPHADLLRGHDGGMNKTGTMEGVRTLAGYADTSSHGRVRFVISLAGNDGEMRFRLLRAIESGL